MKRSVAALLVATAGAAACTDPVRSPPRTLDSPVDVAPSTVCVDADGAITTRPDAGCPPGTGTQTILAIANSGDGYVHLGVVGRDGVGLSDFDEPTPSTNGVTASGAPIQVEALRTPGLFLVASRLPTPVLDVVDLVRGVVVTSDRAALPGPTGILRAIVHDDRTLVVADQPLSQQLVLLSVRTGCGDTVARNAPDCSPAAAIVRIAAQDIGVDLVDLVVRDDGRWFGAPAPGGPVLVGALFGAALETDCGGTPCIFGRLGLGPSCSDEVDDDGDGLVDLDDPQCFGPSDEEGGLDVEVVSGCARPGACTPGHVRAACSDGADNDGDGRVDARDAACAGPADRDEGSGYDDVDGFWVGDVYVASQCPPDGSGACAEREPRSGPARAVPAGLALTREGDLLVAVDRRSQALYAFDADSLERVDVNVGNELRTSRGVALSTTFPGIVVTQTIDIVSRDGLQWTDRFAHVASTSGYAETIHLDTTFTPSAAGAAAVSLPILEPFDFGSSGATVESATCGGLATRPEPWEPTGTRCESPVLPQAALLCTAGDGTVRACGPSGVTDEGESGSAAGDGSGDGADACAGEGSAESSGEGSADGPGDGSGEGSASSGGAYVLFATHEARGAGASGLILDDEATHDYAIAGGRWDVVFDGELAGSRRTDAVPDPEMTVSGGWLRFAATNPCDRPSGFAALCQSGAFDDEACPGLVDWCSAGDAFCATGLDACGLCPKLCGREPDVCALGVLPGDTLVVDRFPARRLGAACGAFAESSDGDAPLEYVICAIAEDGLQVAPYSVGCDGSPVAHPAGDALPAELPVDCIDGAWTVSVRARGWVVQREGVVGPSPFASVDGACVLASQAASRTARVTLGTRFDAPYGVSFLVQPPLTPQAYPPGQVCDSPFGDRTVAARDFRISYDVDSGFRFRSARSEQLLLGPSTAALVLAGPGNGSWIIAIDDANSYLSAFDATTWATFGTLVP